MQVYLDMDDQAAALPYAQIIVEQSADPNDLVNAYYCLMQDAKARGDINKLSAYAHARQDANELLMQSVGNYNGAQTLLEEHLANPYPYRWAWITLLCLLVACLLLVIAIVLHRRYAARRLQVAHDQIEDLSISAQLSDIRATYPRPRKQWNDYNELKKDLEPQLHDWLSQLETYQLSNRENVFCTYMLLYPTASLEDLADWMHYSATGVSTFKRRIAQKIGISTRELYHFLHETCRNIYKIYAKFPSKIAPSSQIATLKRKQKTVHFNYNYQNISAIHFYGLYICFNLLQGCKKSSTFAAEIYNHKSNAI